MQRTDMSKEDQADIIQNSNDTEEADKLTSATGRPLSQNQFQLGADESDTDSERENEISEQIEDIQYGVTPPRHARRIKNKARSVKKDQKDRTKSSVFNKREKERHLLRHMDLDTNRFDQTAIVIPRMLVTIKVDSPNIYRSIKSVPANLDKHGNRNGDVKEKAKFSCPRYRSFHDSFGDYDCPISRLNFMRKFQTHVKLGDKVHEGRRNSVKVNIDASKATRNWQVQVDQLLWLELQAWHSGRSMEHQDAYLLEEREKIDAILDEIKNFHFPTKLNQLNNFTSMHNGPAVLKQKTLDNHHGQEHPIFHFDEDDTMKSHNENKSHSNTAKSDSEWLFFAPHDITHGCSTMQDHFTGSIQQKAMQIIIMLLMKVQSAQSLYPTSKALSHFHAKFCEEKFVRNSDTLNLWLNICKELYHKLQIIAGFIDINSEDKKTWQDWFDHGLGLTCVKTKQTYIQRRHSVSSKDYHCNNDSQNFNTHIDNQQPASSEHLVKKTTSTSRYRQFVEKNINQIGLNGLARRIKVALHATLWKARQALEVPETAQEIMERQHSYGKVTDLVNFFEKAAIDDPSQKSVLQSIFLHHEDFSRRDTISHDRGVWCKEFSDMGLPSFLELYLFLAKIAFDIIHESIRYRLDHRPKGTPSFMSIEQLINECKEVISGAIIGKYYYQDMTLSVLTPDDKARIDAIDNAINEFEEDVEQLLSVYFDYLQNMFQMLQRLPEASQSLKNTMEEEWQFAKEICPHTKGLEAEAGWRFCVLATGLLDSTANFLDSSIDDRSSELFEKMDSSSEKLKVIALEAYRDHKKLFNEIRERASKALAFAKMLQKDLGIAAEFKVEVETKRLYSLLRIHNHMKVDCRPCDLNYEVFTKGQLADDKKQILKLLNVTCGFEDPAEADSFHKDGYILLLRSSNTGDNKDQTSAWAGETVRVNPTVDATIALANLQVDGLMVIACNSYQLSTQRSILQRQLGNAVKLVNEKTSSHHTIAEGLRDFRVSAERLAQGIISSVKKTLETLNFETMYDMDESEKSLVRQNYIETMQFCFNTGFEYLREFARLLSGRSTEIRPIMMDFAKTWMKFVCKNTIKGTGFKPRWSTQSFEFISDMCNPRHLSDMTEDEFKDLEEDINICMDHVIGSADSASPHTGYKGGSPLPMHRPKSHPGSQKVARKSVKCGKGTNNSGKMFKMGARQCLSDSFSPSHGVNDSFSGTEDDSGMSPEVTKTQVESPTFSEPNKARTRMDTIRKSLTALEKERNEKLLNECVIGRVSDKKPDLASDLVKIKSRRVNFKYLLGKKIGEGKFGVVYSCVNMDSGKTMAMKKMCFNPQDYSSIQGIADEITHIQSLKHKNLVEYHGVEIHRDELSIFMEYCDSGTIAQVSDVGLPEETIRVFTSQIVEAVRFLHQHGIVHRDIKGPNIFISSSGLIKLGDFGTAVKLKDPIRTTHGELSKFKGTPAYMAPEVINHKDDGYGRAADIWSIGCVVVEMATGKAPWNDYDWYTIIFSVGNGSCPGIPELLSEEGKDFLQQCFIANPKSRSTAGKLVNHAFVKVNCRSKSSQRPY